MVRVGVRSGLVRSGLCPVWSVFGSDPGLVRSGSGICLPTSEASSEFYARLLPLRALVSVWLSVSQGLFSPATVSVYVRVLVCSWSALVWLRVSFRSRSGCLCVADGGR